MSYLWKELFWKEYKYKDSPGSSDLGAKFEGTVNKVRYANPSKE